MSCSYLSGRWVPLTAVDRMGIAQGLNIGSAPGFTTTLRHPSWAGLRADQDPRDVGLPD